MTDYDKFWKLHDAGKYTAARRWMLKALAEIDKLPCAKDEEAYALCLLADVERRMGRYDDALRTLERVREMGVQQYLMHYNLGLTYRDMEYDNNAIAEWDAILSAGTEKMLRENGGDMNEVRARMLFVDSWLHKAWCLYYTGRYPEAEACALQHLSLRAPRQRSEFQRKDALRLLKFIDKEKVRGTFAAGRVMDKKERHAFYPKYYALRRKDFAQRYDMLQQQILSYPGEYYLYSLLSALCFEMKRAEECLSAAEKSMALLDGTDDVVLFRYANALALSERYEEAIGIYDKLGSKSLEAIAFGRNGEGMRYAYSIKTDALYMKSVCLLHLGRLREARRCLQRHLRLRKHGIPSVVALGEVKTIKLTIKQLFNQ